MHLLAEAGRSPSVPLRFLTQAHMPKSRILVIDDEAAIRDSLRMTLEYEGYEFLGAATGQEGLASPSAKRRTSCSSTSRCRAWTASRCSSGCAT